MSHKAFREQKQHSTLLVPYSFLYGVMPEYYPSIGIHCHPEFELYVFAEGQCRFQTGDRTFTAKAGDLVLVQPDVLHGAETIHDERVAYHIALFDPRLVTGGIEDRAYQEIWLPLISGKMVLDPLITPAHPYYEELKRCADHVISCVQFPTLQNELLLRASLMELFYLLLDSGSIHEKGRHSADAEGILAPAIDYIQEHYTQPLTVEMLAQTVHLSKSYFMCVFRKTFGMPALAYVHHVRIEAVCELLQHSTESITEIAVRCGYPSLANFNRHFQKEVGMTPGEYRRSTGSAAGSSGERVSQKDSIYDISLHKAYHELVEKALRRGHTRQEVDAVICWFTGYTPEQIAQQLAAAVTYQAFLEHAPQIHPDAASITGIIHGMRVEKIEEPLMQTICRLEKLVDDMVRGKSHDREGEQT
ncbi:DUF2200 family protein [uncultured Ruminococcus sp.]|uniref:DUF2200 family protein n=1 Tax=uncultured Ruminococcus sp. TaxID=165186 RepID=UPI00260156F4|nr:DUF2200 family protein [uncultured Ruminococcus sp.]